VPSKRMQLADASSVRQVSARANKSPQLIRGPLGGRREGCLFGKVHLFAALIFLALASCREDPIPSVPLDRALGTVLPADSATAVLRQCTRDVPADFDAAWIPAPGDIRRLEDGLGAQVVRALERSRDARAAHLSPDAYARQYVGLVLDGRRFIYVNAFPRKDLDGGGAQKWRNQPRIVCDGGESHFGVVYDPERDAFTDFEFNDRAALVPRK
jgi:hypothetical protein